MITSSTNRGRLRHTALTRPSCNCPTPINIPRLGSHQLPISPSSVLWSLDYKFWEIRMICRPDEHVKCCVCVYFSLGQDLEPSTVASSRSCWSNHLSPKLKSMLRFLFLSFPFFLSSLFRTRRNDLWTN